MSLMTNTSERDRKRESIAAQANKELAISRAALFECRQGFPCTVHHLH